jgi:lipopolysaccharide export system ATP-binding protein
LLQVCQVQKVYARRRVLDCLDLQVAPGECVGLLGANGAGKSTLFAIVAGLVGADGGRVWLDGVDVTDLPIDRRARLGLGYLDQEPSVFRRLTVQQNLELALEARGVVSSRARERVEALLLEYGLVTVRATAGGVLSGGERRRVEIARALVGNPRYLMLDEPFTGVDPRAVGELQDLVRRLKQADRGLLVTDHNAADLLAVADRVVLLHEGRVVEEGTAQEMRDSENARRLYLGEPR